MTILNKEALFAVGRPIGPLYAQVMKFRAFLYHHNFLKQHHLDVPVISVGNLTMGGTGKTPVVIYLARLLKQSGYRPAVISRGYRGTARQPVNIVSDGTAILINSRAAGDEPFLIAGTLPDIIVATGKKRIFPCREVIKSYGCDAIILDDGFQHLSVARSTDLVLFDTNYFAGNSRVFPGGELREPISALHRCSAFLLTGTTAANMVRADKCADLLASRFPGKPVIKVGRTYSRAIKYMPTPSGYHTEILDIEEIPANLFCFCGIARPERFQAALADNAIQSHVFRTYPDHHQYSEQDLTFLHDQAASMKAPGFLTTEKDMTKLQTIQPGFLPFFIPVLEIPKNPQLDTFILDRMISSELRSSPGTI